MKLQSKFLPGRLLILLPALSLAVACNGAGKQVPPNISVSAADVAELNKPMPGGSVAALTDPVAHARDDLAVERWGMSMSAAWGRVCRALRDQGVNVAVGCGK